MDDFDDYYEIGRNNARLIELTRQHCVHARVEKSPHMGRGMLEASSGLPLDGREVNCRYAANPSMAGIDLSGIVVEFYRSNCVGCEHRQPLGGVPNLATHVGDLDKLAQEEASRRESRAKVARSQQQKRRIDREEAVRQEPRATREWIALLDEIDTEEVDHASADRFLDIARAAPELCTEAAAQVLVSTAVLLPDRKVVEVVDLLHQAGAIPDEGAFEVAIADLSRTGSDSGVTLLVRLRERVTVDCLEPTLRTAIRLSSPSYSHGFYGVERAPDVRLLEVVAEQALPSLLDAYQTMLQSDNKFERKAAAGSSAKLFELIPETSLHLASPLIDALEAPGSTDVYMESPREGIMDGLEAALIAKPREMRELFLKRGRELSTEARSTLFHAFDYVIRDRMDDDVPQNAGTEAVTALFDIVGGSFGEQIAADAAGALELTAHYHPELLIDRIRALMGAIMTAVSTPVSPEEPAPGQLYHLLMMGQEASRQHRLSQLTEALGRLVEFAPDEVFDEVALVLDSEDPPGDNATELRRALTELLGPLGRNPELRPRVIPRLYTALIGPDQGVRGAGIKAWEELAKARHFKAPTELEDLLVALVTDPYVIVHQTLIRAIDWGFPVPERHVPTVLGVLFTLGTHQTGDSRHLHQTLDAAWRLTKDLDLELRSDLRKRLLELARHLSSYELKRFIQGMRPPEAELPIYADLIVQVVRDSANQSSDRDEALMRTLRDLPVALLEERKDQIFEAGLMRLPRWTAEAAEFVEVLEVAGCWSEAKRLAEKMVEGVPDDIKHSVQRADVVAIKAHIDVEQALGLSELTSASDALSSWKEAEERREAALAKRKAPFGIDGFDSDG